jgi:WD40 repeat protein
MTRRQVRTVAGLVFWIAGLAALWLWLWPHIKDAFRRASEEPAMEWPEVQSAPLTTPDSDPLPPGALARLGRERLRQGDGPTLLAFSPDGKRLASVEARRGVKDPGPHLIHVWETDTGKEVRQLVIPSEYRVLSVVFSAEGDTLSALCYVGFHVWDVRTGKEIHQLPPPWGDTKHSPEAALSPDGKMLAWTIRNKLPIHLCETATGQEVRQLAGESRAEFLRGFTADGRTLISSPYNTVNDRAIRFWDVATGQEVRQFPLLTDSFSSHYFNTDGTHMLTCNRNMPGSFRLWDVASGQVIHELPYPAPREALRSVALSADGQTVAAGFGQGWGINRLCWWNTASGQLLKDVQAHPPYIGPLSFSPDGKVLATGSDGDGTIHLWDVATGAKLSPREGHQAAVVSLSIAPDGQTVATVGDDQTLRLWDPATGAERRRIATNGSAVAFSPNGKTLAASRFYSDQRFPLLDATTGEVLHEFPMGSMRFISALAFSPDGTKLAASGGGSTYLWEAATGKVLREFLGEKEWGNTWCAAFSADSTLLAVARDEKIELWDVRLDQHLRRFGPVPPKPSGFVSYLAFSPNGQLLAAASGGRIYRGKASPPFGDGVIRIYDVATGQERLALEGHRKLISCVQFSPDGKLLVSAGEDGTVRLWDAANGKPLHQFEGHRGAVTCVAFAPDGRTVLSGSRDSTALVWDVAPFVM